jgi:hypothetical protein
MPNADGNAGPYHAATAARKRLQRAYLFQNAFVLLVAILFFTTSLSFWLDPDALDRALGPIPPYDYYWNALYITGSTMVVIGLLSQRVGIEAAGHTMLVPGLLLNFLVAAMTLGVHNTTLLTLVFAAGSAFRAYGLIAGWRETTNG